MHPGAGRTYATSDFLSISGAFSIFWSLASWLCAAFQLHHSERLAAFLFFQASIVNGLISYLNHKKAGSADAPTAFWPPDIFIGIAGILLIFV